MIETTVGKWIPDGMLRNYFEHLIDRFFKILPMWEDEEETLPIYIKSLQTELAGFKSLIIRLNNDFSMLTLLSILQFFIDNPDCPVGDVKREVFRAINICKNLQSRYTGAV